jgi:hypothetical protein
LLCERSGAARLNSGGALAVIQQAFGEVTIAPGGSELLESAYKLLSVLADRRTGREVQPQS